MKKEGYRGFFNSQEDKINLRLIFLVNLIVRILSIFVYLEEIDLKRMNSHSIISGVEYYYQNEKNSYTYAYIQLL